ncbi:MAG: aspartate-semialdehyde dehydrogenase [Christensenellales bacterium]
MKKINLAVVGATGMVGGSFLKVLSEKNLPIENLYLFASERSEGKVLECMGRHIVVEKLSEENIKNKKMDFALFSAGGARSEEFAPIFAKCGATVIDNSSFWRMDKNVPLVVPQVNPEDAFLNKGIIANPNCSTIGVMAPLKALDTLFDLVEVDYVTFQAVSGSGMKGVLDLERTTRGENPQFYPYPIFNNCIPQIDSFVENGFTKEEMKMVNESKKILGKPGLKVSATCVRVPVANSHSISVSATFEKEVELNMAKEVLKKFPSVVLLDEPENSIYPVATIATGTDEIYVGRLRVDLNNPRRLHFFTVSDNIRKGAASNAIEILELLLKRKKR